MLAIAEEQEISCDEVTAKMVYESLVGKSISYKMVLSLMEVYHGVISIDEMENVDESLQDNTNNLEQKMNRKIDTDTENILNQVFMDFSELELYIVMKEFGFLGDQIRKMTAKELSYQDYFVKMQERTETEIRTLNLVMFRLNVQGVIVPVRMRFL